MKFIIPINEPKEGETQTIQIVDTGSSCARSNKRKLKAYFLYMGVPKNNLKRVMKAMGFWGEGLGV